MRMAAVEDFAAGVSTTQVAACYRGSRMSAWRWRQAFETGGREVLRSRGLRRGADLMSANWRCFSGCWRSERVRMDGLTSGGRWSGCAAWWSSTSRWPPRSRVFPWCCTGWGGCVRRGPAHRARAAQRDESAITDWGVPGLAGGQKTAGDLGAWIVVEDESGQGAQGRPGHGRGADADTLR
ncbi:helix-turn-helix domain-containing protein [Thermobifida halotolerans]|uniref:helix-turn-helix domain-containing protein n=1 Tax=Thermobifida halotolerans TaxID=483545 RepID=UPI003511B184